MHKTLRNTISDCIIDGLQRPEGKGGWGNSVCSIANMLAVMQMCVFFFPLFRVRPKSGGVSGEIVGCVVPDCFFFSSHLFSRRGSGWSCLTGQLPGMYHLYTGGSGCGRKQGQVQATAPLTRPGRQS